MNAVRFTVLAGALVSALVTTGAAASPVTVQVLRADGQPLAGAVVTLTLPGVASPQPRGSYRVSQHNIAFDPHVLIVPVGATVSFPNLDRVRHHVYSFSPAKKFALKLYGREESRSIVFDRAGPVALGCNIHDAMNGAVYVAATPYAAVTDDQGRVSFAPTAAGRGTLTVWHPSIHASQNSLSQSAVVGANGLSTQLKLRR